MAGACRDMGAREVRVVPLEEMASVYWTVRAKLYPLVVSQFKRVVIEDVTVPRDRIPEFVRAVEAIGREMGLAVGMSGHAGDGNMHPSFRLSEVTPELERKVIQAVARMVRAGLSLGGVVSGEHGVGVHKSQFLEWEMGREQIALMKRVKQAFDPLGIMNPGKIWPQEGA